MNTLTTVVLILQVISSVLLTAVVLFQSGKEAGLSGAIAGGSDSYMSKNKAHNLDAKLARATKWIAAVFVLFTIAVLVLLRLNG